MKLAAVTVLLFVYGTVYTLMVDWMAGNSIIGSFRLLENPFKLMTLPELALAVLLLLGLAASIVRAASKRKSTP
ncbi:hypothetical protein [Cohnella thailandensis]|uniref:Lycopene cyclase domain-containing protein n=1 Tax=Cohnella thailandensis TaxID=557557 RepID=A0A841T8J0_9BACL|nr:hypothetical protein [Cohnella thailandensis]MBB6637501.1 hypothetical protein [Cohnella thailandensis]MBP1977534.1 hypothetical protein [Cohnella thailandensis]